jgi:hypothetical protein
MEVLRRQRASAKRTLVLYVATVISALSGHATAVLAEQEVWPSWEIEMFKQLTALTPELQHPRLLSILSAESQDLWAKGQMRVRRGPWDTLLGDFTGDGQQDVAVILAMGGSDEYGKDSAKYVRVATLTTQRWQRLLLLRLDDLLQRLDEDKWYASKAEHRLYNGQLITHVAGGLIFDAKRHTLGVLTGERERLTKAASISTTPTVLPNGQLEILTRQRYGYVLEKQLILPLRWNPHSGTFQQEAPCWYFDADSEDTLMHHGIDPESERVYRNPNRIP